MTERELNAKFEPFFKKMERKYNMNSQGYGELQPGSLYTIPQIVSTDLSVTFPSGGGTYNLNPLVAGGIRSTEIVEASKRKILIRSILGYAAVYRIYLQDYKEACRLLNVAVVQMILRLERELEYKYTDLHAGQYVKFERPGGSGIYLTDIEDSAGYELRLWSDTYPMVVLNQNVL